MTITEACRVNQLLKWLLGIVEHPGPVTYRDAGHAAEYLADRANAALSAGVSGKDVTQVWERITANGVKTPALRPKRGKRGE